MVSIKKKGIKPPINKQEFKAKTNKPREPSAQPQTPKSNKMDKCSNLFSLVMTMIMMISCVLLVLIIPPPLHIIIPISMVYFLINSTQENTRVYNSIMAVCNFMIAVDNTMWNVPSTMYRIGATILYPFTCFTEWVERGVDRCVERLLGL
jgi:hypothetical protein